MASFEHEVSFVGQFWRYAQDNDPLAWQAMTTVAPEMLEHLSAHYSRYIDRFASGRGMEDPAEDAKHWDDGVSAIYQVSPYKLDLMLYAERVRDNWRARKQCELLSQGVREAEKSVSKPERARLVSERLSMALVELFTDQRDGKPIGVSEMADAEILATTQESDPGIRVPFPKLNNECGPAMPGDLIGLTAYSGGGKSTLAANLLRGWLLFGVPVIAFPTEMRERWLARAGSAMTGIPQWITEKRQWSLATEDQKDAYRDIMGVIKRKRFEIVNRPNISPAEIVAATRVIRKRWDGPCVVIVDHMHRLDYGDEPNKAVGPATKMLKNFASDEGLIFLLLYQPRKPPQGDIHRPTAAFEIRGDSTVWNELDVHISPFRPYVRTDEALSRPNAPKALLDSFGAPVMGRPPIPGKPSKEPCHVTDEYVFIKIDKRRIGGEGPTIWFPFDKHSGSVMENAA